jgi:hypothetical protein
MGCFPALAENAQVRRVVIMFNTVDACVSTCAKQGMMVASLNKRNCYCGMMESATAESLFVGGAVRAGCSAPCPGNENENCGGDNGLRVLYMLTVLPPSPKPVLPDPESPFSAWESFCPRYHPRLAHHSMISNVVCNPDEAKRGTHPFAIHAFGEVSTFERNQLKQACARACHDNARRVLELTARSYGSLKMDKQKMIATEIAALCNDIVPANIHETVKWACPA